jgi:hypothetical protein
MNGDYIEVVRKRIEQWMDEILFRIYNDASLEAIPAAGTERYLKHEILITRCSPCGNVLNIHHVRENIILETMTWQSSVEVLH